MIAIRGRARMAGKSSFSDAVDYVAREGAHSGHETPEAVWFEGVESLDTAGAEMEAMATAARSDANPLYHLIVSWNENEQPTYEQARDALKTQMRHLGFEGCQYIASLNNDGAGEKWHIHAAISRVAPGEARCRPIAQDIPAMQAACRESEVSQGWSRVASTAFGQGRSRAERDAEYYDKRRAFSSEMKQNIAPKIDAALNAVESPSKVDFDRICRENGVTYAVTDISGREGGRWEGRDTGQFCAASTIGKGYHEALNERLGGSLKPGDRLGSEFARPFVQRLKDAREEIGHVREGSSWSDVHEVFRRNGVAYEAGRNGMARVYDLDGPGRVNASAVDESWTQAHMTARFGAFESPNEVAARDMQRDIVRRAENLAVGAQLAKDPSPLIDRLTTHNSYFSAAQIDRVVSEKVIDADQRVEVANAIVERGVPVQDARGRTFLTTPAILREENGLARDAARLAARPMSRPIDREPGAHLDEQQREAYEYLTSSDTSLKVVTGVPGSGKTTLISDVATAYEASGYRVRGLAVANAAVDVLHRETGIDAQNTTAQIHAWNRDSERLESWDVVFIDEASMLGSEHGQRILQEASAAGAVVLALGDDKQFQAVTRGNALSLMQDAVGDRALDMAQTRRQVADWQREATHAVRRGDVTSALDAYRDHGAVHEFGTQEEARAALVGRWREYQEAGVECGIEVATNAERIAVAVAARAEWVDMQRISGPDTTVQTIDGPLPLAEGDKVVIRETVREAGVHNGSVCTVRAVEGSRLQLERSDGQSVSIDTRDVPGVQYAYASTEYREQGATRYAELQLVTPLIGQRSQTVAMTRHTHGYEAYYSREQVGSYQDLQELAARQSSKKNAIDLHFVDRRVEREADADRDVTSQPAADRKPGKSREAPPGTPPPEVEEEVTVPPPTPPPEVKEEVTVPTTPLDAARLALGKLSQALPKIIDAAAAGIEGNAPVDPRSASFARLMGHDVTSAIAGEKGRVRYVGETPDARLLRVLFERGDEGEGKSADSNWGYIEVPKDGLTQLDVGDHVSITNGEHGLGLDHHDRGRELDELERDIERDIGD
jgi:hypothetical protein